MLVKKWVKGLKMVRCLYDQVIEYTCKLVIQDYYTSVYHFVWQLYSVQRLNIISIDSPSSFSSSELLKLLEEQKKEIEEL